MLNTILLQAADGAGGSSMMSLLMIVVLIAIFYFFMIAPQQKKQKKINAFRDSLKKGDKVMTAGGSPSSSIYASSLFITLLRPVSLPMEIILPLSSR